jgi:hypothetical protein
MAASILGKGLLVLLILSFGAPAAAVPPATADLENWYPADIQPPAGTQYPCALTALPPGLPSIPAADRRFVNHVYAMLLKGVQARLVLAKALGEESGGALEGRLGEYLRTTDEALRRIEAEPVPEGLAPFAADVTAALKLQRAFFRKGVTSRGRGASMKEVFQAPEARQASARLQNAWSKMLHRYRGAWDPATKDSLYHHLCALDFF